MLVLTFWFNTSTYWMTMITFNEPCTNWISTVVLMSTACVRPERHSGFQWTAIQAVVRCPPFESTSQRFGERVPVLLTVYKATTERSWEEKKNGGFQIILSMWKIPDSVWWVDWETSLFYPRGLSRWLQVIFSETGYLCLFTITCEMRLDVEDDSGDYQIRSLETEQQKTLNSVFFFFFFQKGFFFKDQLWVRGVVRRALATVAATRFIWAPTH